MGDYIPLPLGPPKASPGKNTNALKLNYSGPVEFDGVVPNKTVDVGNNGVLLSANQFGQILQLSVYHPTHGVVLAGPYEQFDGNRFYDPGYVRDYRTRMTQSVSSEGRGFGLSFGPVVGPYRVRISKQNIACCDFSLSPHLNVSHRVCVLETGEAVQTATIENRGPATNTIPLHLDLGLSLNRASYGQLTEGGPIPLPESRNSLRLVDDNTFCASNPALETSLLGRLEVDGKPVPLCSLAEQDRLNQPLDSRVSSSIRLPPGATVTVRATFRLLPYVTSSPLTFNEDRSANEQLQDWKEDGCSSTYILRRNVDYILGNCTVPISASTVAIITDHVALPLGWNRDNYWQTRLLHDVYKNINLVVRPHVSGHYSSQITAVLKGHLNWVFVEAQRPFGFWHRSYLVTGKAKDGPIFQLDQQCYPILELCDYLESFPDEEVFVQKLAESDTMTEVLGVLKSKCDPATGLWPTDETPGDDAVVYPYHFSSHVLLWRTFSRLRDLWTRLGLTELNQLHDLDMLINNLHRMTLQSFTADYADSGERLFAYLTDGQGHHIFYHDANDIPTLFAEDWKFLVAEADILTWKNTMRFALSSDNKGGYCFEGSFGGLGSVHSPGGWVLGFFQELGFAAAVEDWDAFADAWRRIKGSMQWDGTFPEAVDADTGACTSKAWFSWPGSMIGSLLLKLRLAGLMDRLT